MPKPALSAILLAFSALTAWVVWQVGIVRLVTDTIAHPAGMQVFADLIVMGVLLLGFVYRDAKATGRRFWPWAVFTLTCGSFGPLLYLLSAKRRP